jgi:hypothetical protein
MSVQQIAEILGWDGERVRSAISAMRFHYPGKMVHITGYKKHPERGKDVQILAAGPGEDMPRPVLTAKQKQARRRATQNRYNKKNRSIIDAKARLRRAKEKGIAVAANPWFHLIPPSTRGYATQMDRANK